TSFPHGCGPSPRIPMHSYCGIVECTFLSFTASRMSTLLPPVPRMISFLGLSIVSVSRGLDTTRRLYNDCSKATAGLLQLLTCPRNHGPTILVSDSGRRLHIWISH